MIKKILLTILCMGTASASQEAVTIGTLKTEPIEVSSRMSSVEKKVRESAVKILTPNGHGSGGLVKYKDLQLVITAQHVASDSLGTAYGLTTESEERIGVQIYADPLHDIAVILVPKVFDNTKGMKWKPVDTIAPVSTEITYSGYPSWHSLMTYRGRVAGYEVDPNAGTQIMLDTYGWFGCSGSLLYNADGKAIGVLWGIDVQRGLPQENMMWISPIQNLDIKLALKAYCIGANHEPKACRR